MRKGALFGGGTLRANFLIRSLAKKRREKTGVIKNKGDRTEPAAFPRFNPDLNKIVIFSSLRPKLTIAVLVEELVKARCLTHFIVYCFNIPQIAFFCFSLVRG